MPPDLSMIDGPILTLWRSVWDVMAGAYRSAPDKSARTLRNRAMLRASFTRMRGRTEGVWAGCDLSRMVPGAA
ncbi:MAG: hypothetical protein AAGI09_09870 [Pseudomonadota bacterium]